MHDAPLGPFNYFFVPPQAIRGQRDEMLAEIDRAITGLLVLRKLIGGGEPRLQVEAGASRTAVPRRAGKSGWIHTVLSRIAR